MRGIIKTGMIAGLAAGSVSVDSEASAASGDRADRSSRVVTLDENGRTKILVLDENGRTKLDITSPNGNSQVFVIGGSADDPARAHRSESGSARTSAMLGKDCLAALQDMAHSRRVGTSGPDLSDEENAVLEAFCMMSNAGACRVNAHERCGQD